MSHTHLKSFRGHYWDLFQSISGGLLPIQGPQEGSEAIFWPYFGILNNFPHFLWMIILLNILDCIEWIFCWINILDFVLNWIIFRPDSMKKWIFKTYRQWLLSCLGSLISARVSLWFKGIQCQLYVHLSNFCHSLTRHCSQVLFEPFMHCVQWRRREEGPEEVAVTNTPSTRETMSNQIILDQANPKISSCFTSLAQNLPIPPSFVLYNWKS